jgi:hypothetical protein
VLVARPDASGERGRSQATIQAHGLESLCKVKSGNPQRLQESFCCEDRPFARSQPGVPHLCGAGQPKTPKRRKSLCSPSGVTRLSVKSIGLIYFLPCLAGEMSEGQRGLLSVQTLRSNP